jgi:serine/threonine protein kinase
MSIMGTAVETIGDYELLDKIADGGMGAVYRARQISTGMQVALKLVARHLAKNRVLMQRFRQEYNAAAAINHPNVVRALDFGFHLEAPYMVMEYVEGETLGQRVEREGRIPSQEAVQIISQIAQALHKAHKNGLIHRDVKPDNILLTPTGQAKLADLGLVKEVDAELNLTRTGRGLGTPHFMAPEQFRDAKNVDLRCDIYSLGATLYTMVTGEVPFRLLGPLDTWIRKLDNKLPSPRALVPGLSERLDWAIQRAMSADRAQRPSTCWEFLEDLNGHSTDKLNPAPDTALAEIWHMKFHDAGGVLLTVTGKLPSFRKDIKAGLLGDPGQIKASRSSDGPFEPLRSHPEFRDLVVSAQPALGQHRSAPPQRPTPPPPPPAATPLPQHKPLPPTPPQRTLPPSPQIPLLDTPRATAHGQAGTPLPLWLVFLILALGAAITGYFLRPWLP